MHNNVLQIAAETGIPGLILWLWFMLRIAWDSVCGYRQANGKSFVGTDSLRLEALTASSSALAAWVALMVAGLTEYNFGDSEILTFYLFIASAPYAFLHNCSRFPVPGSPQKQDVPTT
jgi:O-antigen ligase